MTKPEQFFYDNAGFSYNPATETIEQGKVKGAKSLAQAEAYAAEQGWIYEWTPDQPGFEEEGTNAEVCTLYGIDGIALASLCGISGATDNYRRVVEAELALEARNGK
jgi:hypothetical protein